MASRTNKRWIAAKKAQQQKQAKKFKWLKRFEYPKRKLDLEDAKEIWVVWVSKNPKGGEYHRFLRWRKVCRETRLRVDPDGYRYIRTPSWWSEMVQIPVSGWLRTKLKKNLNNKA